MITNVNPSVYLQEQELPDQSLIDNTDVLKGQSLKDYRSSDNAQLIIQSSDNNLLEVKLEANTIYKQLNSEPEEQLNKIMKLKKECRRFKDLLEPLIDLSQPNVTTIMQRPVDMGETKRYKRKNYEDLEKRRVYECKYNG